MAAPRPPQSTTIGRSRLIFLDIDGVICCNTSGILEPRKLELLSSVVSATGAKVVLSTDWRRVPKLKAQLISTLQVYGIEVSPVPSEFKSPHPR